MHIPLKHRSRSEQKAFFAGIDNRFKKAHSYNDFSDKVDSEFFRKYTDVLKEPLFPSHSYLDSLDVKKKKRFSNGNDDDYEYQSTLI